MTRDERYPSRARLRRKPEFDRVIDRGEAFPGREALVRRLARSDGRARLGIATPRRYGDAVRRNRFRRLAREAFRSVQTRLGAYDFLVSPKRDLVEPSLVGLRGDLLRTVGAVGKPAREREAR